MKRLVVPSIIGSSQKELRQRIKKVSRYFKVLQLDIMDGKFVKNKSLDFDFILPKQNRYEAHLMVKDPTKWIEENYKKVETIVFHIEAVRKGEVLRLIKKIKSVKRRAGIAVNPKTPIKKIELYLKNLDIIIIMSVEPGKYGAKFLPSTLNKVKELRKLSPKIDIEVDGGMNMHNIPIALKAGANRFVSGSFLQKGKNIEGKAKKMKILLEGGGL